MGNFYLSEIEFQRKYNCQTNFLNFYQVVSAIPNYLLSKARSMDDLPKDIHLVEHPIFRLANDYELNLGKAKAKDFCWILNEHSHQTLPTGPKKWNREFAVETNEWRTIFKSVKSICREHKLKEFQMTVHKFPFARGDHEYSWP